MSWPAVGVQIPDGSVPGGRPEKGGTCDAPIETLVLPLVVGETQLELLEDDDEEFRFPSKRVTTVRPIAKTTAKTIKATSHHRVFDGGDGAE